jgi:hypothetical protein
MPKTTKPKAIVTITGAIAREISKLRVRYHRNGCAGSGFYACEFLWRGGRKAVLMKAVVFEEPGDVAVLSGDIHNRWDGPYFEGTLRKAIGALVEESPQVVYGYPAAEESTKTRAKKLKVGAYNVKTACDPACKPIGIRVRGGCERA